MAAWLIIVLVAAALLGLVVLSALALKLKRALLETKTDARTAVELQRETIKRLRNHEQWSKQRDIGQYRQVEALIELNSLMGFNLTGLRHWAISPDAGVLLFKAIINRKPETVLELGGGASSVIIAQALKINGRGRLVSIDHQEKYANQTRQQLEQAGLAKYAEVRTAKLKDSKKPKWYDEAVVKKGITKIDFLAVDGPPEATGPQARQPAVPVLKTLLAKDAVIFMDDYDREDEQAAAASWLKQLPGHRLETYDTEKNTAIIKPKKDT